MSITRNFNLMLYKTGAPLYINANQYDEGETWVFTLYKEDGTKYTPTTGAIVGIKSDGHAIANAGTVDGSGNVVITETQQMTAAPGRAIYEILIDNDTHGTANFVLMVEPRPGDNADLSDSDLSLIQQAVDSAETIEELIEGHDPDEVIADAVDAWLDYHPEATTTVQDGAITAPKLNSTLWDKLLVSEEASGAVASFDDGADDVPVSSLKVALEPIQTGSGDPSPSNIRPITGHSTVTVDVTGKNLLNPADYTDSASAGLTWTMTDRGIHVVGTSTGTVYINLILQVQNIQRLKAGTYILSPTGYANIDIRIAKPISQTIIAVAKDAPVEFTLTEDTDYFGFIYIPSGVTLDYYFQPMIRPASFTDDTYEPYQSTSYPMSLGQSVYGGTLDVTTGVLTTTHKVITLDGSEAWSAGSAGQGFYTAVNDMKKTLDYSDAIICDKLPAFVNNTVNAYTSVENGITGFKDTNNTYPTSNWMYAKGGGATTSAGFKTWLSSNNLQVCYELATPTTTQLTAEEITTLLGNNIISASSGSVNVIYRADTKMYVDNEISKAKSIIAGIETGFTATKNYTTGNLLIIGDDLYKVTANIANGSAITVNTNVTKTTVAEQLIALA